jgi:hypothetical protein
MAVFHRPQHVEAVLLSMAWRRATIIEHFTWTLETSDNEPFGHHVRNVRSYWDAAGVRRYEFEKQVWHTGREVATSGDSPAGVQWGEFSLWDNERVHKQTESYTALFRLAEARSAGFTSSSGSAGSSGSGGSAHGEHHGGLHLHHAAHEWQGEWRPDDSAGPPAANPWDAASSDVASSATGAGQGTLEANLDEATWRTLELGMKYHLELNLLGHVHAVSPATS